MKLAEFSVKNYQFTIIIFIAVMVLGLSSLLNMPRGEDPPFNGTGFPIIAVYPGASPSDMEELVVKPIEDRMYELEDIKKIVTTISDGLAVIIVEFNHGVNIDKKKTKWYVKLLIFAVLSSLLTFLAWKYANFKALT